MSMTAAVEEAKPSRKERLSKGMRGIRRQVIEFQKATFEGTFDAIVAFQDQQEQFLNNLLERTTVVPDEGREVIHEWIETFKRGREDFKKSVDRSYELVEQYFDRTAEEAEAEAEAEVEGEDAE
jgi:hypothetical protein